MTNGRPSGSTIMPLQNMSKSTAIVVTVSVWGSQTAAVQFGLLATFPDPDTINNLPLCISAMCTGLMGTVVGSVCQVPVTLACAPTGGAEKPALIATKNSKEAIRAIQLKEGLALQALESPE